MRLLAGNFTLAGKGGIRAQAHKAIAGQSDFQHEFELINTFQPDRLARLCPLLILGDRGDPVAPESSCLHFAQSAPNATVRMAYDEGGIIRSESAREVCGSVFAESAGTSITYLRRWDPRRAGILVD